MKDIIILGIESSCDDTAASVLKNGFVLSNIVADQQIHQKYGGVVPELASRAHQQKIVPVVDLAIETAGIKRSELTAIAFTRGPGLLGSLIVGSSFAQGLGFSLGIPVVDVNHMQAHVLAHFIEDPAQKKPGFPFLCLTVSGGHSQIVLVRTHFDMDVIGETIDDAAGEAFDKAAKLLGLPYPGGPMVDKMAAEGSVRFDFPMPSVKGYDYSFSGLKTSLLYFIQKEQEKDPDFARKNLRDICASYQSAIVTYLFKKLILCAKNLGIREIAIAGGVSANSHLRAELQRFGKEFGWNTYIPKFEYCTDNAAMIGIVGHYKLLCGQEFGESLVPTARLAFNE